MPPPARQLQPCAWLWLGCWLGGTLHWQARRMAAGRRWIDSPSGNRWRSGHKISSILLSHPLQNIKMVSTENMLSPPNSELRVSNGFPRKESNHFRMVRMGVRHSLQTPGMEHTFIIKTTICCICSIDCLYYFLQLENNGKMMKGRMPWWHDE